MGSGRYDDARRRGRVMIAQHLGLADPDVPRLLELASEVVGPGRVEICIAEARLLRLSQRYHALASIAALTAGTKLLGSSWWSHPTPTADDLDNRTPDALLQSASAGPRGSTTTLDQLEWLISDAAAVTAWGDAVDSVDLNDPRLENRFDLPPGRVAGDRVVLSFDAGGVVDAVVEEAPGTGLVTRLDLASCRYSVPAEVSWGWAVGVPPPGPFPLPGDDPNPYDAAIDRRRGDELRAAGLALGLDPMALAEPWATAGDLCASLTALNWPWLNGIGASLAWQRDINALLDGAPRI